MELGYYRVPVLPIYLLLWHITTFKTKESCNRDVATAIADLVLEGAQSFFNYRSVTDSKKACAY